MVEYDCTRCGDLVTTAEHNAPPNSRVEGCDECKVCLKCVKADIGTEGPSTSGDCPDCGKAKA